MEYSYKGEHIHHYEKFVKRKKNKCLEPTRDLLFEVRCYCGHIHSHGVIEDLGWYPMYDTLIFDEGVHLLSK